MRRRTLTILRWVVTPLIVFLASFLALRGLGKFAFPDETTDIAKYGGKLNEWSKSGLAAHFPAVIPPEARNVRFASRPKVLQGGAYLQLRMQLPKEQVAQQETQFKRASIEDYSADSRERDFPRTILRTADDPNAFEFPSHFTIYILMAKNHGTWNHGQMSGVAVSSSANEVIYWADEW